MTSQTIDSGVIATFNNRQEAVKAKEAIVAAGISSQKVVIDGYTKPRAQVAALGTTAGGAAGIWLGLGYGGVIGIIVAAVLSFFNGGTLDNSAFNRLTILGLAVAGAVVGAIYGKQVYDAQPIEQKQKADPEISRQFRLVIQGSQSEIEQAQQAIGG